MAEEQKSPSTKSIKRGKVSGKSKRLPFEKGGSIVHQGCLEGLLPSTTHSIRRDKEETFGQALGCSETLKANNDAEMGGVEGKLQGILETLRRHQSYPGGTGLLHGLCRNNDAVMHCRVVGGIQN